MEEIEFLLSVPGMPLALRLAPLVAVVVWIFITVNLWRGGFTDLTERLSRPRYAGPERARAVMMIPLRALMLAGVAGFAAVMTVLGLLFNAAVILNIIQAVRGL
ncbi:MAG: hypothetical protein CMH94_02975 [Oceanicaulis sp.]|uniref:Uncharacterized protein n=1 Tax=Maricaulis virginensis TaxID=144022 RepID=A0A9W6MNY3_9PROT|nr:hypothetical protein [Maricaulis virginensis]MAC39276.1 hypothetical protein [Oceanicaulis sp.]MAZ90480.1 hypothetical protein [Maricaulis sp.]MBI74545.1 hypothetical protein [Oceanicaulis sp.]GLK52557.1 hypothetical protein GCM10017621_20650 [Maricaulis virginensis]